MRPGNFVISTEKHDYFRKRLQVSNWSDMKGIFYYELLKQCYPYLPRLTLNLKKKSIYRAGKSGSHILQGSFRSHIDLLTSNSWILGSKFFHTAYSPDLLPRNYHLIHQIHYFKILLSNLLYQSQNCFIKLQFKILVDTGVKLQKME